MGIGVVFGKSGVLDHMPPWQGGGNMIQDVTLEKTLYQPPPQRFEAGTGNIADPVSLGAASTCSSPTRQPRSKRFPASPSSARQKKKLAFYFS